ncbi:MAG: MipA/OmpV family protein [Helicobacteraceae bacterium]|jgi:outer membrane scaffolding protein for murein synthesis (MipA/OmpV family)|nr:MipA/OmpV family protein [Helicobacteraceae bacterium]
MVKTARKTALLIALCFGANIVYASDSNDTNKSQSGFGGSIGFGVMNRAKYEGSKSYGAQALPVLMLNYKIFFISPLGGIGFNLPISKKLIVAPALSFRPKRPKWREEDEGAIKGFKSLGATAGANVIYKANDFTFSARVFSGFSNNKGVSTDMSVAYAKKINDNWGLNFALSAAYADKNYNQIYYGVTQEYSQKFGFDIYEAKAGFRDIGFGVNINYNITKSLSIGVLSGYRRLIDVAADSPIVKAGTPDQYIIGALFAYRF